MKQSKQKHVPMRTCIATGKKMPKRELIRIVKTENGPIEVDLGGKKKGRGANISMDLESLDSVLKKNTLQRALKLARPISLQEGERLRDSFEAAIEEKKFRQGNKKVTIKVSKDKIDKLTKSN